MTTPSVRTFTPVLSGGPDCDPLVTPEELMRYYDVQRKIVNLLCELSSGEAPGYLPPGRIYSRSVRYGGPPHWNDECQRLLDAADAIGKLAARQTMAAP